MQAPSQTSDPRPLIDQSGQGEPRAFPRTDLTFDVVVVGAGPAGICAALAAARGGAKTALVTDRPVLGGSASSEVRVTPSGADHMPWNRFARETGIMEEISLLLADKTGRSGIWRWLYYDETYFDLVTAESNLTFFLNTSIFRADCPNPGQIGAITGVQLRAEKLIEFHGKLFIDCSGDGVLGFLAGADYRVGREAKAEFQETHAPEKADRGTMGATLLFSSIDRGHPVPFRAPAWALAVRDLPTLLDPKQQIGRNFYRRPEGHFYGLWWAEYGGIVDSIHDDDDVTWHTRRLVYGLWDYIKNSGKFEHVERHELDWIGYLPGKRESRRLMGPVIPTANDFLAQRQYDDRIGYAGWPVDIHPPQGYRDPDPACTHDALPGITDIPFGCLYSRNVGNLLFAGRDVSVSHEGLGVLRVIATTAVMGQAAGEAAALCIERALLPAQVHAGAMPELQRRLARNDQSLIGYRLLEDGDLSRTAAVTASSVRPVEVTEAEQWFTLTERFGLILPVNTARLERIAFRVRALRPAELVLRVFAADKPENYRFSRELCTARRTVDGDDWVEFALDADPGPGGKLLFAFEPEPSLLLGYANTRLTGVLGMHVTGGGPITDRSAPRWTPSTPCFRTVPALELFAPANAIDGHIRPYGLSHCWCSQALDPAVPAWLELTFAGEQTVGRIEVVFNTDLNRLRHDVSGMYPELVKDYDLVAVTPDGPQCVVRERGNTRRLRTHAYEPVRAVALRLVIHGTWGSPYAEVFDLRVYPD